jgi:hypothetical protein
LVHPTRDSPATTPPDLDDVRWLTSAAAIDILTQATALTGELTTRLKQLRGSLSPERARLVMQQVELRQRARDKFSAAERMFFTPTGLEQSTDEIVATYKAARFAGRTSVYDLCSGIGGDLVALAAVAEITGGTATGFDRDPIAAEFAAANARVFGCANVSIRADDVTSLDLAACDAWHLDPDRRPQGRRTTRVELHEPSAEAIDEMLARNPRAAIKLAPAATWPEAWNERAEWEWISRGRQCRQLVAWFGGLATHAGQHRATILSGNILSGIPGQGSGSAAHRLQFTAHTFVGPPGDEVPVASAVGRFIYEPDAAVLAAKLSGALAAAHNLSTVAAGIAYWTGDTPIDDPLLACFEVETVLPFDIKKLKALLRERHAGPLEIKVRGLDQNPAELRKRLDPQGTLPYTILLTRIDKRVTAIVGKRRGRDAFDG